jgi:rhamnose transport system substrate-binding protein
VPTGAPDRKGKKITVVDVPKLIGIGYFNATSKGIADAAAELGNVKAKTDGPTKANIDDQITVIDNYITRASTASCSPPTTRWPSPRC